MFAIANLVPPKFNNMETAPPAERRRRQRSGGVIDPERSRL